MVEWLGPADLVTQADLFRSRRKELHSSTLLMRRQVFDRVGDYDEKLPQSYAEDYEWLLRAVRLGPIGVVREPLATIKKDGQSWFRERNEVVSEALQYVLDGPPRDPVLRAGARPHPRPDRLRRGQPRPPSGGPHVGAQSLSRWPLAPQAGLALVQVVFAVDPAAPPLRPTGRTGTLVTDAGRRS